MIEIRWHGRGGQGAFTASEILAKAVIRDGKWAQAFPRFGPERRGAPVLAFTRISNEKILVRSEIREPDIVIVLDPTLAWVTDVKQGLKENGIAIFNSDKAPSKLKEELRIKARVAAVNATFIAYKILGGPFVNMPMLGAFAKVTGLVSLESLFEEIREAFPGKIGEKNVSAVILAYNAVRVE